MPYKTYLDTKHSNKNKYMYGYKKTKATLDGAAKVRRSQRKIRSVRKRKRIIVTKSQIDYRMGQRGVNLSKLILTACLEIWYNCWRPNIELGTV